VPQVLTFVFLSLTSVVAVYKDIGNMTLTLATCMERHQRHRARHLHRRRLA
jgi:hypothetical protein